VGVDGWGVGVGVDVAGSGVGVTGVGVAAPAEDADCVNVAATAVCTTPFSPWTTLVTSAVAPVGV